MSDITEQRPGRVLCTGGVENACSVNRAFVLSVDRLLVAVAAARQTTRAHIATPRAPDESTLVDARTCWFHKNRPLELAVAVVTTAVSLLIAPCVSVTVSVAVYVPALA